MIVSLHRNLSLSLDHATFGHDLLDDGLKKGLLFFAFDFEYAFQLFVRKVMFTKVGFWWEYSERMKIPLSLHVLRNESIAYLFNQWIIDWCIVHWLIAFEFVYYLLTQLKLHVVY